MKIIGMIHLPPLPGSPRYSGLSLDDYLSYALSEADKLFRAGFDGLIVENYMDYPYSIYLRSEEALRILGSIVERVKREYGSMLVGLNILRNSGVEAVNIICRFGGDFIRVNAYLEPVLAPEGFLEPVARRIWELLSTMDCRVGVYADVNVKHSKPLIPLVDALHDTCSRGRVDGVIVTGKATGKPPSPGDVFVAKKICDGREVWVGSGIDSSNIGVYVGFIDGVIIGTSIKEGRVTENPVRYEYAVDFVEKARALEKRVSGFKKLY